MRKSIKVYILAYLAGFFQVLDVRLERSVQSSVVRDRRDIDYMKGRGLVMNDSYCGSLYRNFNSERNRRRNIAKYFMRCANISASSPP